MNLSGVGLKGCAEPELRVWKLGIRLVEIHVTSGLASLDGRGNYIILSREIQICRSKEHHERLLTVNALRDLFSTSRSVAQK